MVPLEGLRDTGLDVLPTRHLGGGKRLFHRDTGIAFVASTRSVMDSSGSLDTDRSIPHGPPCSRTGTLNLNSELQPVPAPDQRLSVRGSATVTGWRPGESFATHIRMHLIATLIDIPFYKPSTRSLSTCDSPPNKTQTVHSNLTAPSCRLSSFYGHSTNASRHNMLAP